MPAFQLCCRTVLLLILAGLAGSCLLLWSLDYAYFTNLIFSSAGQPEKLAKFRTLLLTPERFGLLRWLAVGVTSGFAWLTIRLWSRTQPLFTAWQELIRHIAWLFGSVRQLWRQTTRTERVALLMFYLLLLVAQWYFAFRLPFHIDERFTYLYFVSKGLGVSLAYYPNPNNHILFTLLCSVLDWFIKAPFGVMKVAALLAGALVPAVFWVVVRRYFPAPVAWLALVLFATSEKIFYYATQGRGYSLQMVWVLVAVACILRLTRPGPAKTAYDGWFFLSCALGFYTIPTFLFPFTGLVLYALVSLVRQKDFAKIRRFALLLAATAAATLFLYLPVFLFNGWSAVSGNSWVASTPLLPFLRSLPAHLWELAAALWWFDSPLAPWLTLGMMAIASWRLLQSNESFSRKQWSGLWLSSVTGVMLVLLWQRVMLYARVLTYLAIFIYPLMGLGVMDLMNKWIASARWRWATAIGIGIISYGINVYHFNRYTDPTRFDLYNSFNNVALLLYRQRADTIYTQYYEYSLCIRFQYQTNGRSLYLDTNQPQPGVPYRFVIVHKSHSFPRGLSRATYHPVYSDPEATVYKRVE